MLPKVLGTPIRATALGAAAPAPLAPGVRLWSADPARHGGRRRLTAVAFPYPVGLDETDTVVADGAEGVPASWLGVALGSPVTQLSTKKAWI